MIRDQIVDLTEDLGGLQNRPCERWITSDVSPEADKVVL
jgi:hypothetical protein